MKRFNKISWKFIITSTVILVIVLIVTTAISTNRFGKAVTGFVKDDLQRTAEENAAYISRFYDDKTRLCVALSEEDIIIQGCLDQAGSLRGNHANPTYHNYAKDVNPARWNELCIYLNRNWEYWNDQLENMFVGDIFGYAHCGAFDLKGIPTSGILMNVEGRGGNYWARAVEGETAFGDLEWSPVPTHEFLASAIAVPVKDSGGSVCGLAAVSIDSRPVMKYIQNNSVGDTGYTVLLDRYGRILSHPNAYYCLHGLPDDGTLTETYLEDLSGSGWVELQESMLAQEDGFATVSQGGRTYQVYYQSVDPVGEYEGMGLSVASVISDSELHEEANSMRNTIIIIAVIAILVAVLVCYWIARRITKPIKDLQAAADKVSKGETDVAIDIKSKDEVGDLAESFNRMMQAVKYLMQDKD
jgi:HAMP domain-containing protein